MPMLLVLRARRPGSPLTLIAGLLVAFGLVGVVRDRIGAGRTHPAPACAGADDPTCVGAGGPPRLAARVERAEEVCSDVGYLCAELERTDRIFVRRWKNFTGTLVVHVPAPDFESPARARELQRAASAGIRAWHGQPFPIVVDERGNREAHVEVRWSPNLGGTRIGQANTAWSAATGLRVRSLDLASQGPYGGGVGLDPAAVRLVAAHEMGHALGLPHSDSERDVMYPTNTANIVSARDHKTMQALYALEDGIEIVR